MKEFSAVMKKVLVVGYLDYTKKEKLVKEYPNIVWLFENDIRNNNSATSIVALVDGIDEVMFAGRYLSESERLAWEVACVMLHKKVSEESDYPVEDKEKGEEA